MNTDPLAGLLQAADAAAPSPPAVDDGLADRVRGLRVKRVRRRVAAAGGGVMIVALAVFVVPWFRSASIAPPTVEVANIDAPPVDAQRLQAEIEALRIQADVSTRLVEQLRRESAQRAKLARLARSTPRGLTNPQLKAAVAAEQAAFTILAQATQLKERHGLDAAADDACRRIIRLFPQTRAAEIARERLGLPRETQGDRL